METATHLIYGLVDPYTGHLRYVGKTSKPLEKRLAAHFLEKSKTHKVHWIQSVLRRGANPIPVIIQRFEEPDILNDAECHWISYFKKMGCPLTNGTAGGDGVIGWEPTPEWRAKIGAVHRGRIRSPETRKRMSLAQKGKPRPWMIGREVSSSTREKLSKANKGKRRTGKSLEGIRTRGALRGRKVADDLGNVFPSVGAAAIFYDVDRAAIRRVARGLAKTSCGHTFQYVE